VNTVQLIVLTLALLTPAAILTVVERVSPRRTIPWAIKARVGVSLACLITASGHFFQTAAMAEMLPPFVPFRIKLIYFTGVLELLGARCSQAELYNIFSRSPWLYIGNNPATNVNTDSPPCGMLSSRDEA
jgi:hypothetical protein